MGISEEQFWRLTLKQYDALVRRLNKKKKDDAWNVANIMAQIHNAHITKESDAVKPQDFMPRENKKLSGEELKKKMVTQFAYLKKN